MNMNNESVHEQFMKEACDLADHSVLMGGGPFGCVIVSEQCEILGKGHNQVTIDNDPTQHAEIVAIRNACKNINDFKLSGCTLYTSCEPCSMCLSAIYWARISKIVYGNTRLDAKNIGFDDFFIYDEINKPCEQRQIPMVQDYVEIAKNSFELWANKKDKTEY